MICSSVMLLYVQSPDCLIGLQIAALLKQAETLLVDSPGSRPYGNLYRGKSLYVRDIAPFDNSLLPVRRSAQRADFERLSNADFLAR